MQPRRVVCVLTILISAMALAQSNPALSSIRGYSRKVQCRLFVTTQPGDSGENCRELRQIAARLRGESWADR
jgi:hypothetical protein